MDIWETGYCIDGRAIQPQTGAFGDVVDPSTGEVRARMVLAAAAEVDAAVAAATRALPGWSQTPPLRRARVLFRFKELVERHADEIAALIATEYGTPNADAPGSLQRGLEGAEYAMPNPTRLPAAEIGEADPPRPLPR